MSDTAAPAATTAAAAPDATMGTFLTDAPATTTAATTGTPDATAKASADGAKPAEGAKAPEVDKGAAEAKPDGPPEKYEFKFAEGVEVAPQHVESFSTLAKELGLSQANAQKLIDYQATLQQAVSEQESAKYEATVKDWRAKCEADPEIGGPKAAENRAIMTAGFRKVATPELTEFLTKTTRLGDHPEICRLFHRIGKAISEDTHITAGASTPSKSLEQVFYGDSMKDFKR